MPRFWPALAAVPVVAMGIAMIPGGASAHTTSSTRPPVSAAARIKAGKATPEHISQSPGKPGTAAPPIKAGTMSSPPSMPVGTGPVPNATFLHFSISDKVALEVNVGSGDALLTTSDIAIPEQSGSLTLGTSYNSLLTASGVPQGAEGYGWRQREGVDVQLYPATSNGSVTMLGEDGVSGVFTAPTGSNTNYGSPAVFHAWLTKSVTSTCSGSTYQLTWHQSGERMCFNTSGLITSQVDRDGNTTAYGYNGSGQETSISYTPEGASSAAETVTASYTGSYLTGLSESGGSLGTRTITYTVNASTGNLTSVQQADGTLISFGYDSSHDLTSIENGDDLVTQLGYNSAHQVTSVTQQTTGSSTATTRLSYVSATETQVATPDTNQSDPVSSVPNITYTLNAADLVTDTVDQAGDSHLTGYNTVDNVNSVTGAAGSTETWSAAYSDGGENLSTTSSPMGAGTGYTEGLADTTTNPTAEFQYHTSKDAEGNQTTYTYDGPGNLATSTNTLPAESQVNYKAWGAPNWSKNPRLAETTYYYNALDQLTTVDPPTSGSLQPWSITYDGYGRVATVKDGDGNTVTYTYDNADRITKAAYTGGTSTVTVSYTYDGDGNLHTETSASGTTTYGYDGRNLATSITATSGGGTLSYGYNGDGDLTSVTDGGGTTDYYYDNRDLMYEMQDPEGNIWWFKYDADGRRTATWFDTNTTQSVWASKESVSYDLSGRISQIETFQNTNTSSPVSNVTYCYSAYVSGSACPTASATTDTSLLQYSENNLTGAVTKYTYDKADRLTKITNASGTTLDSYGYDADGNLTSGAGVGSLTYNTSNQITTSGYSYDGAGNLTSSPSTGAISYNDAEQTTGVATSSNGNPETFTYAGDTQDQVLSDGNDTAITYGLNGQDGQPQIDSYQPYTSSHPVYILRDQQGDPLGYVQNGKDYAYLTDNLGSVTGTADTTGAGSGPSYGPWGQTSGSNQIGYTGALSDPDLDLDPSDGTAGTNWDHFGDRWYSPGTGSFTTADPQTVLGDPQDANVYAYAGDDPANEEDPTGQAASCQDLTCGWKFSAVTTFILQTESWAIGVAGPGIACIYGGGAPCGYAAAAWAILGGYIDSPPAFTGQCLYVGFGLGEVDKLESC